MKKISNILCEIKELAEIAMNGKGKDTLSLALIIEKIEEIDEMLGDNYEIYKLGDDKEC